MTTENQHVLSVLCLLPLLAAGIVLLIPARFAVAIRRVTVGAMVAVFAWSLRLLGGDYSTAALQFRERYELVPNYGITFSVGVDGMSLWLILLATFIIPAATYACWGQIQQRVRGYAAALLLLEAAILGGFVALDLFLFFVCWELTLIPMFLIIGIWGGQRRTYAAMKFVLFSMAGSALMLIATLYLVAHYQQHTGRFSFELEDLKLLLLPASTQLWLFSAFALAFAVKLPLVPFHTWLPDAYTEAPIGGTIVLSAVLAKLAAYGFLRFAMPLFPAGSHQASSVIVVLSVGGIIYAAYCAWSQADLKTLVAYSSVSHLGFVMLGIYTVDTDGVRGSILQMVNHGISTGALFLLVGVIYARRGTLQLSEFGGIAKVMPVYATVFVVVTMSAIGLPTTNGFIGEFMILAGAFMSEMLGRNGPVAAALAATALVLAPLYILHAVFKLFWGPLRDANNRCLADLSARERLVFAPLLVLIFYIGLVPNHVLAPMSASVDRFAVEYVAKLRASERNPQARDLLDENYQPKPASEPQAPDGGGKPLVRTLPSGALSQSSLR